MDDTVEKIPDKKIFFVIGVFFSILMILVISFFFLANIRGKQSPNAGGLFTNRNNGDQQSTQNPVLSTTPAPTYPAPPKLKTSEWTFTPRTQPGDILASQTYTFKQNYSLQEVRTFVQNFFTPSIFKNSKNQILAYSLNKATKDTDALTFDIRSGSFSFFSTKGISLSQTGVPTNESLYLFLRTIGLYDPSIQVTAQYQRGDVPGVTYFELHRDWHRMGLPILNFVGVLNMPESQNLAALSLNSLPNTIPDTVINATDGRNGLARQNDFNTITIAIDNRTNKIVTIDSNIRKLDINKTQTKNLITYAQAIAQLKKNAYELAFVSPSGSGVAPWTKMYPNNEAVAKNAIVTDAFYTYLEQPSSAQQNELKPYILFRGYADLESGYRTSFVTAVQADQTTVLGESTTAPEDSSQKNANQNPDSSSPATGPLPTIPANCTDTLSIPAPYDATFTFMGITLAHSPFAKRAETDDKGNISYWDDNNYGKGHWFYIPPADLTEAKFKEDLTTIAHSIDEFVKKIGGSGYKDFRMRFWQAPYKGAEAIYNPDGYWNGVLEDFSKTALGCPIRITGGSPTIFIYGKPGQALTIRTAASLTYTDPAVQERSWNVMVNQNNLLVNGVSRDYIYYEYVPVVFTKPQSGWIIKKTELNILVKKISTQLKLNVQETSRLAFELSNAATPTMSSFLFVGVVDMNEVNQKVPLTISPQPEKVYRYHFYVGQAKGNEKVSAPSLLPIQRKEFMILELGSYQGK